MNSTSSRCLSVAFCFIFLLKETHYSEYLCSVLGSFWPIFDWRAQTNFLYQIKFVCKKCKIKCARGLSSVCIFLLCDAHHTQCALHSFT
ncbi:hypothetical protein FKM82_017504 [Ascaphus truei]